MWTIGHSDDGPDHDWIRRMSAPENEVPVALPLNRLLARTDDVAVALLGMQVYSTGLAFELVIRVRPEAAFRRGADRIIGPHHRPLYDGLLLGVELADGRRASNTGARWGPRPGDEVVLAEAGGHGGDTSYDQSLWLDPLPPDGPLRFVVRCDDLGIAETAVELDGTAIRRAADHVLELWPWEPPRHEEPPPPEPDVPPGSWFAR